MKSKTFDCVEMKRKGAERLMAKLATMTPEEEDAFWREKTAEMRKRQQELREQRKAS